MGVTFLVRVTMVQLVEDLTEKFQAAYQACGTQYPVSDYNHHNCHIYPSMVENSEFCLEKMTELSVGVLDVIESTSSGPQAYDSQFLDFCFESKILTNLLTDFSSFVYAKQIVDCDDHDQGQFWVQWNDTSGFTMFNNYVIRGLDYYGIAPPSS